MRRDLVGGALLAVVCSLASCSDDTVRPGGDLARKLEAGASDATGPTGERALADRRTGSEAAAKVDGSKVDGSKKADGATSSGTVIPKAYVTGYSWYDNTPPGSSDISNPIIHQKAGGTGTWADPITVAVGHDLSSGKDVLDYPAGTRFYIPDFSRYFIVEDTCGDGPTPELGPCHVPPSGATTWLDVWIGGSSGTKSSTDACMNKLTGIHQVVKDPDPNRPVKAGEIFSNGSCQI
jgi:hypothetical protein